MRVSILSSGLGSIHRGYERFTLEMAEQLRLNGLQVSCWGSADGPDVEGLRVLNRKELERLALDRLRGDSMLESMVGAGLHTWSMHTEDQLFGIAAAARLERELHKNEPLIVYLKWQGGLVDAGGGSTPLFERLESATKAGVVHAVIHTDWVYPPIVTRLAGGGMTFHSIASWLTQPLQELGVPPENIIELPMGTSAAPLLHARACRDDLRQALNIPPDAFVILSVGAFDNEVKNFPYLVRELAPLANDERVYWIVAGPRGPEISSWEKEARELLGTRFVPMVDVPFEKMPEVYALGDLFLCGSLNETFGLVYVEAQLAGLPCVTHDYHVTQWISIRWPSELQAISRVDMHKTGATLTAVREWQKVLTDPAGRIAIAQITEQFRLAQENRFAWEKLGARFAEAFREIGRAGHVREPFRALTMDQLWHRQGVQLFQNGKPDRAIPLLAEAIRIRETAERWNDWATAQITCGQFLEAEAALHRALELDPVHPEALSNLAIVLIRENRTTEAIPLLKRCLSVVSEPLRPSVEALLAKIRAAAPDGNIDQREVYRTFLEGFCGKDDNELYYFRNQLERYVATLAFLPDAQPAQQALELGAAFHHLTPALLRLKGYSKVRCADIWDGRNQCTRRVVNRKSGETFSFVVDNFDVEHAPWPYADESFDSVLYCEMLEHLVHDPMQVMSEINRVLKPDGLLLLSIPNIASTRGVDLILRRESPYFWGQYELDGRPTDRHNREYAPDEVVRLMISLL